MEPDAGTISSGTSKKDEESEAWLVGDESSSLSVERLAHWVHSSGDLYSLGTLGEVA